MAKIYQKLERAYAYVIFGYLYEANPVFRLADLEAYLHISTSTVGDYVSDIRARRREAQKTIAYRLHLLGWTQEEIAHVIGTAHDTSQRLSREFPDLEKSVKKLLDSGIPHLDVAERFKLPLSNFPLSWPMPSRFRARATRNG